MEHVSFFSASLLCVLLCAHYGCTEQSGVAVVNEWNTGFTARFGFRLQSKVTNGRVIILTFSKPALKLKTWIGDIKSRSADSKRYVITNKPWQKLLNAGYELSTEIVLTKAAPDTTAPTRVAVFQRLGPGGGGNTGGGGILEMEVIPGVEGTLVVMVEAVVDGRNPLFLQPLIHTTTTKFCASQFSSTRCSEPGDIRPQTESLGEKAQLFAMARMLVLILAVAGTMQEILSSSGFPWPTV